jgi:hypothetical protein
LERGMDLLPPLCLFSVCMQSLPSFCLPVHVTRYPLTGADPDTEMTGRIVSHHPQD